MGLLRYKIFNSFLACVVYNDAEKPLSCDVHFQNWIWAQSLLDSWGAVPPGLSLVGVKHKICTGF